MVCPLAYGSKVHYEKLRVESTHKEDERKFVTNRLVLRSNPSFGWLLERCVIKTECKGRPRNRPYQQWLLKPKYPTGSRR